MSILCPQIYSEGTLLGNYDKKNQTISNENGVGAVSSPGYLKRSFPRTSPLTFCLPLRNKSAHLKHEEVSFLRC